MENLNLYAVCNRETGALSNLFTGFGDKEASEFFVGQLDLTAEELKSDNIKSQVFLQSVRECDFVKVGFLDLLTHNLTNDFNVLVNLSDYGYIKDNEKECVASGCTN